MRAVLIRDKNVIVDEIPDPRPAAGDVVVDVVAAGLNAADLHQVAGQYPAPPGWPTDTPGMELAGRIAEVGSRVEGWQRGDRVMALVGGGAHAEKAVVRASALLSLADSAAFLMAGGFPEAFTTAWDALISQAGLIAGERVLVTGATGGVGTAAIQVAAATGARVVASVRDGASSEKLTALVPGLEIAAVGDEAAHGPFDVILELVGGDASMARVGSLAIGGRIVVIGVGAGARVPISLGRLMAVRGRVMGSTLRARTDEEKGVIARSIARTLVPGFAAGLLSVPIDSTFPLESAVDAYARMAQSGKFGKVVLTTGA